MSEVEVEDSVESKQPSGPTVSVLLVSAREKCGLSQKEVADELFLTTSFIKYIDDGEFEKIPKPAFIKGYLRTYSRTVGLDGNEIVALYQQALQAAEDQVRIRDVTEETVGSAKLTGPVVQTGLIGLVGVVIVIGLVWWIASSGDDDEAPLETVVPEQALPRTSNREATPVPEDFGYIRQQGVQVSEDTDSNEGGDATSAAGVILAQPGAELTTEPPRTEALSTPEASADDEAVLEGSDEPGDQSGTTSAIAATGSLDNDSIPVGARRKVSIERNSDGGLTYITLDAGGPDEIEMSFSDECWLEIEDGEGDSIYGDLNKDGDVLLVYGIAPFSILLGRATGVDMKFNGERIDLASVTTQDRTAKVRLDR